MAEKHEVCGDGRGPDPLCAGCTREGVRANASRPMPEMTTHCQRTQADHEALPWHYCDQRGCGWMRPAKPQSLSLAEEQVAEILRFCDEAERVYREAGIAGVPGLEPSAALVSTHGIRSTIKHVENKRKREEPSDA